MCSWRLLWNNVFCLLSLGCGIGCGYLHRVPTLPFGEDGTSAPSAPPAPLKDGFTEVTRHVMLTENISLYECHENIYWNEVIVVSRSISLLSFQLFRLPCLRLHRVQQSSLSPARPSALAWPLWLAICRQVRFHLRLFKMSCLKCDTSLSKFGFNMLVEKKSWPPNIAIHRFVQNCFSSSCSPTDQPSPLLIQFLPVCQ